MLGAKDKQIRELNIDLVSYASQASGRNSDAQLALMETQKGWKSVLEELTTCMFVAEDVARSAQESQA